MKTIYIKANIDNTEQNKKCNLWGDIDEIVNPIIDKLAQKQ